MPALRWFGRRCAVAADDLVLSAAIFFVLRLLQLVITAVLIVTTLVELNRSEGCSPDPYALFVFFVFGTFVLHLLILITEWGKLIVSKNGAIVKNNGPKKRNLGVSVSLTARALLGVVEVALVVIGWFVVSKTFKDSRCTSGVRVGTVVLAVMLLIDALLWVVRFLIIWDPVGCYSTGFISHVIATKGKDGNTAEGLAEEQYVTVYRRTWRTLWLKKKEMVVPNSQKSLYNASANVWLLRLRAITGFTCLRQFELESTLTSIAKDLSVLFDDSGSLDGLTLTDIAAALLLVKTRQKTAGARSLKFILQLVESKYLRENDNQVLHSPYVYKPPEPFNGNEDEMQLLQDAMHYFDYAIGMYGWKMYCFHKPFTGWFRLAWQTGSHWCCCPFRRHRQSYQPTAQLDDCGCSVASLALYTKISKQQVLGGSAESELFKAPFCLIADEEKQAIVITIRGTMCFQDVLTDLSVSMLQLDFPDDPLLCGLNTQVHKGMFMTAKNILNEIFGRRMLESHPDYPSILVVGHSLGGGVASIIALLLRTYFCEYTEGRDVRCFAFSPPGCVFSYALTEYSRDFVTTFVCGEDFVPSLNWRSLLHLRCMIGKELKKCDQPKYKVFYGSFLPKCSSPNRESDATPSLPSSAVEDHTDGDHDQDQCDLSEESYQSLGVFKPSFQPERANMLYYFALAKKYGDRWRKRAEETRMMQQEMTDATEAARSHSCGVSTYTPAFIPGRVLHIEVDKNANCCSLSKRHEEYRMTWKTNEDFSVLTLGRKSLLYHLPNVFRDTMHTAAKQALTKFGNPPQDSRPESKTYHGVTVPAEITVSNKPVLQSAGTQQSDNEIELENINGSPV